MQRDLEAMDLASLPWQLFFSPWKRILRGCAYFSGVERNYCAIFEKKKYLWEVPEYREVARGQLRKPPDDGDLLDLHATRP